MKDEIKKDEIQSTACEPDLTAGRSPQNQQQTQGKPSQGGSGTLPAPPKDQQGNQTGK